MGFCFLASERTNDSLDVWKFGRLEIWTFGNLDVWKYDESGGSLVKELRNQLVVMLQNV